MEKIKENANLFWIIPVYGAIIIGMNVWPSAWVALLGFHLTLGLALLPKLRTLPSLITVPVSPVWWLLMACLGLVGGVSVWVLWPFIGIAEHYQTNLTRLGMISPSFNWAFFIAYFGLINPFFEEFFWRHLLTSSSHGPALVDFLFAGYHIIILAWFVGPFWWLVALLILATSSWLWRRITQFTGSLIPVIIFHMFADLSIVWVIYQKSL